MVTVRLSHPEEFPEMIRVFREDICRYSGCEPDVSEIAPTPYALYLFAFTEADSLPVGMLELYFVIDAYRRGDCPKMGSVIKRSGIAPLEDVIYVQSVAICQKKQNSRVLTALCQSTVEVATSLRASCLTAANWVGNRRSATFQKSLGMTKLATLEKAGQQLELSYLDLDVARERVKVWGRHRPTVYASPKLRGDSSLSPRFATTALSQFCLESSV